MKLLLAFLIPVLASASICSRLCTPQPAELQNWVCSYLCGDVLAQANQASVEIQQLKEIQQFLPISLVCQGEAETCKQRLKELEEEHQATSERLQSCEEELQRSAAMEVQSYTAAQECQAKVEQYQAMSKLPIEAQSLICFAASVVAIMTIWACLAWTCARCNRQIEKDMNESSGIETLPDPSSTMPLSPDLVQKPIAPTTPTTTTRVEQQKESGKATKPQTESTILSLDSHPSMCEPHS